MGNTHYSPTSSLIYTHLFTFNDHLREAKIIVFKATSKWQLTLNRETVDGAYRQRGMGEITQLYLNIDNF